ncbi:unnamed protein product [Wuchereria bancrofti]|uniref:Uncharacterized protein n=1 Tax=Wuchereria bancrofti TaxID=6293 RepID=A0A3P7ED10_WUCBA|nr:unnamed protein product [Wuchereria bancrofti]
MPGASARPGNPLPGAQAAQDAAAEAHPDAAAGQRLWRHPALSPPLHRAVGWAVEPAGTGRSRAARRPRPAATARAWRAPRAGRPDPHLQPLPAGHRTLAGAGDRAAEPRGRGRLALNRHDPHRAVPQIQTGTARPGSRALPRPERRGHLRQRFQAGLGRVAEAPDHADQRASPEHDERRGPQVPADRDGQVPLRRGIRPGRRLRTAERPALDTDPSNPSNSAPLAQVAQLVEQGIENPRVGGSIPSLGTMNSKRKASAIRWGFLLSAAGNFQATPATQRPSIARQTAWRSRKRYASLAASQDGPQHAGALSKKKRITPHGRGDARAGNPQPAQTLRRPRSAQGHFPDGQRRRRHLHSRLFRLRQVHLPALHQPAGKPASGADLRRRRGAQAQGREERRPGRRRQQADQPPAQRNRLRLPEFQPVAAHERARQHHRGAAPRARPEQGRGHRGGRSAAGQGRHRRQASRLPQPAVRRPAAACGHRPYPGHAAEGDPVRRADLGAGPGDGTRSA